MAFYWLCLHRLKIVLLVRLEYARYRAYVNAGEVILALLWVQVSLAVAHLKCDKRADSSAGAAAYTCL